VRGSNEPDALLFCTGDGGERGPKRGSITTYSLGRVATHDSGSIEQEAHAVGRFALAIAKRVHQFLQLGGALNLEEHLVVSVGDLDVEMLVGIAGLGLGRGGSVSVGHRG
jgi:hypothetical protein